MKIVPLSHSEQLLDLEKEFLIDILRDYKNDGSAIALTKAEYFDRKELYDSLEAKRIVKHSEIDSETVVLDINWSIADKWHKFWFTGKTISCSGLVLNTSTHEVLFGQIEHQFDPETDTYKFLILLMKNKNKLVSHEVISQKIFRKKLEEIGKDPNHQLMRDLKRILKIPEQNKSIFKGIGGYIAYD